MPVIVSNNFLNDFITILIPLANVSKHPVIKSFSNKKSLNLTRRSPIPAVKSNISLSNAPRTADKTLNANFKPPPAIVVTISKTANKPLKVLFNLPAVSSVILIFVESLWNAAIILNNVSDEIPSNVSFQASPIALKVLIIPSPMFLNELMSNQRPVILSILSMNSFKGIPSLSAVSPNSLKASICSSV